MSLADKLKGVKLTKKRSTPLWDGPEADTPNGGITFSALSRFLVCRERFRVTMIEGLRPTNTFNHKIEYGSMWHVCEEWYAKVCSDGNNGATDVAFSKLMDHCRNLCKQYPTQQGEIDKWYNVVKMQFPEYVKYWAKHPDTVARIPLLQEQTFNVPYKLPSGRVVRLRGKWDAVDLVSQKVSVRHEGGIWERGVKDEGIWLFESKTKGDIREGQIQRQLSMDLQTQLYLIALEEAQTVMDFEKGAEIQHMLENNPIKGVRYNVIRRPLSGGKGTIVQRKGSKNVPAETKVEYYARLATYIQEEPETYFMRWNCAVTPQDIQRFRQRCLDPVLEQLADWYTWITKSPNNPFSPDDGCETDRDRPIHSSIHYQTPYGIYSPLLDGGESDLDQYLTTGSTVGLTQAERLFTEL